MSLKRHMSGGVAFRERDGAGPVLILLHGIGSAASGFAPVIERLPRDWRVIAWEAPGYAGSKPLKAEWPLAADYAEALAGLMDRLGIARAALAGHSLGALIAGAFAASRPERVTRVLFASPALGHGRARGDLSPEAASRIAALEAEGAEAFAAARAARLLHRGEPAALEAVRAMMASVKLPGYAQASRMLASGDLLADAARIGAPADVICGAEDAVTPPEGARRLFAALPRAGALTLVPEAGHALATEAPEAFAAALRALMVQGETA